MANPELGGKQLCPTCSSKFYDLNRRPAHCPKCGAEFDPEEALRNRRVRMRPAAVEDDTEDETPKTAVAADADGDEETEADEAPELDAVVDEPPLLADDDDAEDDAVVPGAPAESLGVDFADDDDVEAADDDGDDDGVAFIEDDDDDFPADEIDGLPAEGGPEDR